MPRTTTHYRLPDPRTRSQTHTHTYEHAEIPPAPLLHNLSIYISTYVPICLSDFMCLFFFISGYFSPSSLERKGRFAFLQDKYRRLGQPFVFFLWVMGPLLAYFVQV